MTSALTGKVAVVTGGAGLLGRRHACALSQAGAFVVVADLNAALAEHVAHGLPGEAMGVGVDVTDEESVRSLAATVGNCFNRWDVLVNDAAVNDAVEEPGREPIGTEDFPIDLFSRTLAVNVTGTFLVSREAARTMIRQGTGSIITIASTYALVGPDQRLYLDPRGEAVFVKGPAYPASKGAVLALTRHLATAWGHTGVRVNALTPGGVENGQPAYFRHAYAERTPLRRMARTGDFDGAVVFLASDASAYMTGANLVVDGGWTAW